MNIFRLERQPRWILSIGLAASSAFFASCSSNGSAPNSQSFEPATSSRRAEDRAASSYQVIYRFSGRPGGAQGPWAGLINVDGTLYGTTFLGGASGVGTVFSVTPSGTETVLHSFGSSDGIFPKAGLINVKGTLYGATFSGGASDDGTVYHVSTSGAEGVLYSFTGGSDGESPYAGLFDSKGSLVGTTFFGGDNSKCRPGCGTIYKVNNATGAKTLLYSFAGAPDGARPQSGFVSNNGSLYGTTAGGGEFDKGTVFSLSPTGPESVVHSFKGGADGAQPEAGLINVNGTMYGTTYAGGASGLGTVFKITASGTETVLHSFSGGTDGAHPQAGLINVKGTLYGTTAGGGESGYGTVYSISTSGEETVLHTFGGIPDGALPLAGRLVNVNGTLYGTTYGGGKAAAVCADGTGCGTVFALTP